AVTFFGCNNLIVANLEFKNAQKLHLFFDTCVNVKADNLNVIAPKNSPNTDGIHVAGTQNIEVMNCVITTGDDCISIINGSRNVRATDITSGPGHGISIGSLGGNNANAQVSNVVVDGANISGTTNGVRIKTWQYSAVQISNVLYNNITGTSYSEVAIKFNCSKSFACQGISLRNVDLVREGYGAIEASCQNVGLSKRGWVSPTCPDD
ncbi:hypothetical protein TorRG33x02_355550, partial [Trema orientale]